MIQRSSAKSVIMLVKWIALFGGRDETRRAANRIFRLLRARPAPGNRALQSRTRGLVDLLPAARARRQPVARVAARLERRRHARADRLAEDGRAGEEIRRARGQLAGQSSGAALPISRRRQSTSSEDRGAASPGARPAQLRLLRASAGWKSLAG